MNEQYAYSAWAPAFAEKMKLSSTQSNLIVSIYLREIGPCSSHLAQGTFGNLGMYVAGIPVGLLVDSKGPFPGALLGAMSLGTGYFAIYKGVGAPIPH